jgi:uncharacterized Zn finger protein (UPF0148 family)
MNKCEECNVPLIKTPHLYDGKPLFECPKCEEEYC